MNSDHHLKALKLLVFSLALILIGGIAILGGVLWKRASLTRNADMLSTSECPGGQIDLRGRGMMIDSKTEDQILRVTLEKITGHDEILTIDTCTGKIIGTLTLETDPGIPQE